MDSDVTLYVDMLTRSVKGRMSNLLTSQTTTSLFDYFADVSLHYGDKIVRKTLGSFFAKLVHTLKPDKYCALDNPIKDYLGLWRESFFVAFVVVSRACSEWTLENPTLVQQMRAALERRMGKAYGTQMTDLKVLDLILWHQTNVS